MSSSEKVALDPNGFQVNTPIAMPGQNINDVDRFDMKSFLLGAGAASTSLLSLYIINKNSEQRRKNKTHTKQKPSSFAI